MDRRASEATSGPGCRRTRWSLGVDYERVDSVSRSFSRTGDAAAPFSANYNKRTVGVYVENTTKFGGDRTVVTLGGRLDRITSETLDTPLSTNFTPSASTFNVFNPSLGLSSNGSVWDFAGTLTAGRAFIPAEASMLTGFTTTVVGGRTQINQGNPDLKPERSTSVDAGAGVGVVADARRHHGVSHGGERPVHFERHDLQPSAARSHRADGPERTRRAYQRD